MSGIAKRMTRVVGVLFLLMVAASAAYYRSLSFLPFALGALLGVALNVGKIVMLDRTVNKAVQMEQKDAGNYVRLQQLLRFVLTGMVFLVAALVPYISIWGAAAGICTLQVSVFFAKREVR